MMKRNISYFVLAGSKILFSSSDLDKNLLKSLCVDFSLHELISHENLKSGTGIFTFPYNDGALIGFIFAESKKIFVCVIQNDIIDLMSFHEAVRFLWDSNDFRRIMLENLPKYLQLDDNAQPGFFGKYPFVTLSMSWPSYSVGYLSINSKIQIIKRGEKKSKTTKLFIMAAVILVICVLLFIPRINNKFKPLKNSNSSKQDINSNDISSNDTVCNGSGDVGK